MIPFLLICHCTSSSFSDNQRNNIVNFETFQIKIIYTAYPDDTTFFLKNAEFVINLLEIFEDFLHFPSKRNVKQPTSQLIFTCSNSTVETPEKVVKKVQS